jgi:hypothetical protein
MRPGLLAIWALALGLVACSSPATDSFSTGLAAPADAGFGSDGGFGSDAPFPPPGDAPGEGGGSGIFLDPNTINLVGIAGSGTMASGTVTGSGITQLTSVELIDFNVPPVFGFVQPTCASQSCSFPGGILLPTTVELTCVPAAGMPRSAMVAVHGPNGTSDSSLVTCSETATGAAIQVPGTLGPLTTAVDTTVSAPLTITNSGSVPIDVSVSTDPLSDWNAGSCVAPATCPIAVNASITVTVSFTPTVHGPRDSTLAVTSSPDAGTKFVTLSGTGLGGVLQVNDPGPPAFSHNFGTIAKNQLSTFNVKMSNPGNDGITITPSNPGAPFSVPTAGIGLAASGGTGMFTIGCESATPGGPFALSVNLGQSPNTYDRNTSKIDVQCTIANTTVQVTPTPIDFQELRKGDPAGSITVTIKNPAGNAPVTIDRVKLRNAPAALTLGVPTPSVPATLAPDTAVTATLELATTEDVTLTDVILEVQVTDTEPVLLELPVAGKVGTPSARVIPDSLDLGTVCVGTPVTGTITLTNNGTATLHVQRPVMSSTSFAPLFETPTEYPPTGAELLPNSEAKVGVMPATSAAGLIQATLEWAVDAPASPFEIPITLEYVASGTAVSPSRLVFGAIDVDGSSPSQTVTLENCGTEPVLVTVNGISAEQGGTNAWVVDPRSDQRPLLPDETMKIMASFAPKQPGHHKASIVLDVGGTPRLVELDGDAVGARLEQTSFYACNCNGSGNPAQGWPIVLALLAVMRRRAISRCPSGSS